jgi:hypothetical protein
MRPGHGNKRSLQLSGFRIDQNDIGRKSSLVKIAHRRVYGEEEHLDNSIS